MSRKENGTKPKKDIDYVVKMSFVYLGLGVVIAIIVASWLWNLIFDPSRFDLNKWLNRTIFNSALSLATMVLGYVAFYESLKNKENGKYQNRLSSFLEKVKGVYESELILYFDQFLVWYSEKQLRNKKIKHLTNRGMNRIEAEIIVDYASVSDIPTLTGLAKGQTPTGGKGEDIIKKVEGENGEIKEVLIKAFEDQYAYYVEEVLGGKIILDVETPAYYLSVEKNRENNLESLEQAQAAERDKYKSIKTSFISKTVIGVIYLTLAAMLFVDQNSDMTSSEAIWEFILRILSATIGFVGGGFVAILAISFTIKVLGKKKNVLVEYKANYEKKEFVPKTREQLQNELIEHIKNETQKAKENVVDPEVEEPQIPLLPNKEDK